MKSKGKEISGKASTSKRKRNDTDKSGGRKKKNAGVLQFFDVAADVDKDGDESNDDDFDRDFMDGLDAELKDKNELGKSHHLPFLPKEEELSDDELERLLEERYRPGSRNVVYAEDEYETKTSGDINSLMPSVNDPIIWRVKCTVGRERQTAFCLIQKYFDLQSLGTKLKIVSAFALEHMKGYIYIEAEKECDVVEASKGLCSIYSSRMSRVPKNEVSHLFSLRNTLPELPVGTWVRSKYGKYKGDLAQVVAVDDARKKATVKLIPRIDLQAMAKKLAGGATVRKTDIPAPRLISSTELEGFRPHIQCKRDRRTGEVFDTIGGLMLKDGYLYKKVSIESLTYSDVLPSADELQRFRTCKKDASDDMEWLSHLYGEQQKKSTLKCGKGTTKGLEGTSGTKKGDSFQLHDLVFFGRKDFGVIIGVDDDNFQILKDGVDGVEVLTVELHEIKNGSFDNKFTALDQHMKTISINDTVRVLEGPLKDKQGVVRQIYRGTIFIYDENQLENGGYFCAKAQLCEKISHSNDVRHEKIGDESGPPGFEDSTSPKSPQLPNKPWQAKENNRDFNGRRQGDRDGDLSIGQSLRIRVGPLKGYICRVIAIYRSEVTVKLDSQMKVIKVKREHLSEAGVKSVWGPDSNIAKPFDGFGTQGSSRDLADGSGTLADSNGWNSGVPSTGRDSWPDFPASSDFLLDSTFSNPFGSLVTNDDPKKGKDEGDDPWGSKAASKKATDSWDTGISIGGDLKSSWSKTSEDKAVDAKLDSSVPSSWETEKFPSRLQAGCSKDAQDTWGTGKLQSGSLADHSNDATGSWGKIRSTTNDQEPDHGSGDRMDSWNDRASKQSLPSWDKGKGVNVNETGDWGKAAEIQGKENGVRIDQGDSWGKASENWKAKDGSSGSKAGSWGSATATQGNQTGGWGNSGGSWTRTESAGRDRASSWNNSECASGGQSGSGNWSNAKGITDGGADRAPAWNKGTAANTEDGDSNRTKGIDGDQEFAWNKGRMGNEEATGDRDQTGGWGNSGGSWTRTESAGRDRASSWNNTEGVSGGQSENWGNVKDVTEGGGGAVRASAWNKGSATNTGDGGWNNRSKGIDGDQEFGWNKGRTGNKEAAGNRDQQDTWGRPRSFDGGQGSGGRRGRGGFRGGNRDNFNGGRSFGRGGWNKDQEHRWTGDGASSGPSSSGWNNDQADGWNKAKAVDANQGSGWGNATQNADGNKNQGDDWRKPRLGDDHGSSWNKGRAAEHQDGDTGFSGEDQGGWKNGTNETGRSQSSGWDGKASNWNNSKGNHSSGWNQGLTTNEETGGSRDQGFDWNKRKASVEDQGSRWKSGTSDTGGNQSSGWNSKANNWNNPKGNQSSGWNPGLSADETLGDEGNKRKDSGEDQGCSWKSGTSDAGGNQSSGWDNKNISNSQKDSSGHQSSAWVKGFAANEAEGRTMNQEDVWNRRKSSDGGQATGWKSGAYEKSGGGDAATGWNNGNAFGGDQSSSWNKGPNTADGSEDRSNSGNRTFGSRDNGGNNWRGGRSFGRGRSSGWNRGPSADNDAGDPADFSNQPRGLGRGSSRGGFGNRGRGRRDQSGGWNRGRAHGEDQSFGWSKGTTDNAGDLGSNDRAGSWNQGGRGKGQWQNWNKESGSTKETGGTSSQACGWSGQGSGWNQSTGAKESDGQNSGTGSTKEAGGTNDGNNGWNCQGSGWGTGTAMAKEGSETKDQADDWNRSHTTDGGQWSGWKKGTDSTKEDFGTGDRRGGWNKEEGSLKEAAGPNTQAGGWNSQGSGNRGSVTGDGSDSWNRSNAPVGPQSSGWNKPIGDKETGGSWDHAAASSWDIKKDGSSGKGGW